MPITEFLTQWYLLLVQYATLRRKSIKSPHISGFICMNCDVTCDLSQLHKRSLSSTSSEHGALYERLLGQKMLVCEDRYLENVLGKLSTAVNDLHVYLLTYLTWSFIVAKISWKVHFSYFWAGFRICSYYPFFNVFASIIGEFAGSSALFEPSLNLRLQKQPLLAPKFSENETKMTHITNTYNRND